MNHTYEYNNQKGIFPELGDKPASVKYDYKTCPCWLCDMLRSKIKTNSKGHDGWITNFGDLVPLTILVPQYHFRHLESLYNIHKTGHVDDDMAALLATVTLDLSAYLVGYRYPHIKKLLDEKNRKKALKSERIANEAY